MSSRRAFGSSIARHFCRRCEAIARGRGKRPRIRRRRGCVTRPVSFRSVILPPAPPNARVVLSCMSREQPRLVIPDRKRLPPVGPIPAPRQPTDRLGANWIRRWLSSSETFESLRIVLPLRFLGDGGPMTNDEIGATMVAALDLDLPPIAIAFVEQPPAGITTTQVNLPSSCAFWRSAEQGVFYAPAEGHFRCAVGAMVMGFELPETVSNQLQQLVGNMCSGGYIAADEPPEIPPCRPSQRESFTGRLLHSRCAPMSSSAG